MRFWLTAALATGLGGPAFVQDSGHVPDYRKCKRCSAALAKAIEYVKPRYKTTENAYASTTLSAHFFTGLMALMDDSGQLTTELNACVAYCCRVIRRPPPDMTGWHLGMCAFFLSEYALRYGGEEVKAALSDGLKLIANEQESTGGWGHFKNDPQKEEYAKNGGSRDLGILTAMIVASFLEMELLGIKAGPVGERALKYLESISDGQGFNYGSDLKWADLCMSRGAYALLGLIASGKTSHPFHSMIVEGLGRRYTKCADGHSFGPMHYFGVAAAMHRLGPGEYKKFTDFYLDKLISDQKADGSLAMTSDGGTKPSKDDVASTAVLACIIMMQKPGAFAPKIKDKPQAGSSNPSPVKKSGFSTKNPAKKD